MAKLTLNTIGSRYGSIDALNDNFNAIEAAFENTLSRDGTGPNNLEANLDADSNRIMNLPTPVDNGDAATKEYVDDTVSSITASLPDIETVADNIASVQTVSTNIASVNGVNTNISNVNTVASNISNVNTTAGNTTNINTVAGNTTNINTVATNITSVNTAATNIAAIIAAPSEAAAAAASAAAAAASAASGMYSSVQDKSANYTVVAADAGDLIRVNTGSGAVTITLPQISTQEDGFKVAVVKWSGDANAVTVQRSGSDLINGATTFVLDAQYKNSTFVADFETNTWFASGTGAAGTNIVVDSFSGTGSQTAFTLSGDPGSENNTQVFIAGVYQEKDTYSVSGSTLTFSTAPPSGTSNIEVVWSAPLAIGVPSDSSVSTVKIADSAVTTAKIADDAVTFAKMQNVATASILGRSTAGTGDIEALTVAEARALIGNPTVDVQTYDSTPASPWSKPTDGQTMALIECWGAGGGASRGAGATNQIGGGGGMYARLVVPLSSLGATETVTVGAAGAGRTGSTGNGSAGGNSSFGSWVTAYGGSGGGNSQLPFTSTTAGGGGATSKSGSYIGHIFAYDSGASTNLYYPAHQTYFGGHAGLGSPASPASSSIYGGGGGGSGTTGSTAGGTSMFGGAGGNAAATPSAGATPGGGGGASTSANTNGANGGSGRVRITCW